MSDSQTLETANSTPRGEEGNEHENEGPSFAEMDPSGRYGRFNDVLGRGACKVVYKAFDTQEGTEVAWNQVRLSDLMATKDVAKEDRDRMFAEIRVLKALKHKNIMSFYDSWFDPKTLTVNFITELFTSGTLRQYRKRHKHVDPEVLKRWAWQILCGLVYLHGHNPPIIHRDLKCDNIFINGSDGVVKIGDLGLATMLRSRTAPQSVLGTPEFMAPELYEEDYDDRVDVYSFGMALLELATLEYPYAECTNAAQIYRKVSLGVRPQGLQKVTSRDLAEFINTCIAPRAQRPRARQLLKHPYFDTVRQTLAPCKSELSLAAATGVEPCSVESSPPLGGAGDSLSQAVANEQALAGAVTYHHHNLLQQSGLVQGPPSVASSSSFGGPPSRTVSGLAMPPEGIPMPEGGANNKCGASSDNASVRSQRSNGSELAAELNSLEIQSTGGARSVADAGSRMGSHTTSRAPSPPDSPPPAAAGGSTSPPPPSSAAGSDNDEAHVPCRCAATDRCFQVMGKVRNADEADAGKTLLNLRLRITEPDGTNKTVEFEFDLTHDTVGSVASEMVTDLELSPDDADAITVAMRREITKLSSNMGGQASMNLKSAAAALQAGLMENALLQANSSALEMTTSSSYNHNHHHDHNSSNGAVVAVEQPEVTKIKTEGSGGSGDQWEEAYEAPPQLPSTLSACSLLSEASVASAHSLQSASSAQSIQSSPAQLAVPVDSSKSGAAPGPPQAGQRLTRAISVDRQGFVSSSGNAGGTPIGGGGGDQRSSGVVSPGSGVLSPVGQAAYPDKRSLFKLFENLQEVALEREGCATPTPASSTGQKPPLPPMNNGHRLPSTKSSPPSLFAAILAGNGEAGSGGGSFNGEFGSEGSSEGAEQLQKELLSASSVPTAEGLIAAKPLTSNKSSFKDKEALRKQAADAMKAVELRSLTLLEGSLGGNKNTRGTPMAANRNGSGVSLASSNGNGPTTNTVAPLSNNGAATPTAAATAAEPQPTICPPPPPQPQPAAELS